jgi:hypothetical protein
MVYVPDPVPLVSGSDSEPKPVNWQPLTRTVQARAALAYPALRILRQSTGQFPPVSCWTRPPRLLLESEDPEVVLSELELDDPLDEDPVELVCWL